MVRVQECESTCFFGGETLSVPLMNKNLGHLLLAIYLIYIGVATFVPALSIQYVGPILALAAGILLLLKK
jgi:hypothetical protein